MSVLLPWEMEGVREAGCDEAGRGCLAGPVVAASVVLGPKLALELVEAGELNDSKKLTAAKRNRLRHKIEQEADCWCVAFADAAEIDQINILQASFLAMRRAVKGLDFMPDRLLIDGNRFVTEVDFPPHACHVKGDGRFASIAAASILAKTHRDAYMTELSKAYTPYKWGENAGYPTAAHRQAIRDFGTTRHHRRSFRLLPEQLPLFDG